MFHLDLWATGPEWRNAPLYACVNCTISSLWANLRRAILAFFFTLARACAYMYIHIHICRSRHRCFLLRLREENTSTLVGVERSTSSNSMSRVLFFFFFKPGTNRRVESNYFLMQRAANFKAMGLQDVIYDCLLFAGGRWC